MKNGYDIVVSSGAASNTSTNIIHCKFIAEQEMQDLEIQDFGSNSSGSDLTDDSDIDEEEIAQYLDTLQLPGAFSSQFEYISTSLTINSLGLYNHNLTFFYRIIGAPKRQLSPNASSLFQVVEPGQLDKESTVASNEAGWEQESVANTARQISLLGTS